METTKKQRRGKTLKAARDLQNRLTLEKLFTSTSVFETPIGNPAYDPDTVAGIKNNFAMWFNSWVADDLNTVLNSILKK